jgi:hypothetical protein
MKERPEVRQCVLPMLRSYESLRLLKNTSFGLSGLSDFGLIPGILLHLALRRIEL